MQVRIGRAAILAISVAFIEYSLNGGPYQRYTESFIITASGTTQLSARATDWAGNVESPPRAATLAIDTVPPTIAFTLSGTAGVEDWYRSPMTVASVRSIRRAAAG